MWFETHAHLSDPKFDADRDEVIKRAFEGGIDTIVEIADGPLEWEKAKTLAERYPKKMWWAAGIHPYFSDQGTAENLNTLKSFASHPQFVAIGEVGLDYAKCPISPDVQKKTFEATIEISFEVKKPLIIHCRDAYADLHPILKRFLSKPRSDASPGVIHCFSGNSDDAKQLIEMGFYLGVDGPVTYPNANALRLALSSVPLDKLVLETDSPYLPPQSYRGQRNEPSYLPLIGQHLAHLRNNAVDQFSQILRQNSTRLFRLSK
jgi:TatD DNase family protein